MKPFHITACLRTATPAILKPLWARLEASPLGYRLAKGAFWSLVGAVLSRGLGVVASILVARMLGKQGFGELGIIQSTVGMFGTVALFGLGITATKYVAEYRERDPARASRIISLSAIVSWVTGALVGLALYAATPWLAEKSLGAPHLAKALQIAAVLLFFEAINGAQTGALAGFEAYRRIAQLNLVTGLASFVFLPGGCWLFGLPGAVGGLAATQAFGCALNRWGLAREARRARVPLWASAWRQELPVLWGFSLPAVLASLLVAPTLWFSQTLLVRQPSGYQGMAEYAVGNQWRALITYLPGLLSTAYLPVFSSLHAIDDAHKRFKLMLGGIGFSAGVTLLTALPIFLAAPWILAAYGTGFQSARWILGMLLIAGVADSANGILLRTLMAANRAWLRLISNGLWAIIQIISALILVPTYGAWGLAISVCVAQVIHLAIQIPLTLFLAFGDRAHANPA